MEWTVASSKVHDVGLAAHLTFVTFADSWPTLPSSSVAKPLESTLQAAQTPLLGCAQATAIVLPTKFCLVISWSGLVDKNTIVAEVPRPTTTILLPEALLNGTAIDAPEEALALSTQELVIARSEPVAEISSTQAAELNDGLKEKVACEPAKLGDVTVTEPVRVAMASTRDVGIEYAIPAKNVEEEFNPTTIAGCVVSMAKVGVSVSQITAGMAPFSGAFPAGSSSCCEPTEYVPNEPNEQRTTAKFDDGRWLTNCAIAGCCPWISNGELVAPCRTTEE